MTPHASTLDLDLYFADGQDAAVAEHVARCPECAAYLEALRALDGDGTRLPVPAQRPSKVAPLRRFVAPAAAVLALAAALVLWARTRNVSDETYVGVKGAPALQILVRDTAQTRIWDGRSAVHAGDAVALHVACEQLEHVTVTTAEGPALVRLWDGPCPRPPAAPRSSSRAGPPPIRRARAASR